MTCADVEQTTALPLLNFLKLKLLSLKPTKTELLFHLQSKQQEAMQNKVVVVAVSFSGEEGSGNMPNGLFFFIWPNEQHDGLIRC